MSSSLPHVLKSDLDFPEVGMHTFPFSSSASFRIYSSTEPHNWKIGDLQKGLILVHNGTETVGEGTGFGVPVLVYSDETFFSGSSKVDVSKGDGPRTVCKEFVMDRVARNRFRNVTLENRIARRFFTRLADVYQKHPTFRFLTLKDLTGKMDVDTTFLKASSKGKVVVTYTMDGPSVEVRADFRDLQRRGLEKIFMLNEHGSRFFREYADSEGAELVDTAIGAWDGISAKWSCLKTLNGDFGFRLWKAENSILRRGREFLKGSLDWVGLDYEVNPLMDVFEYVIEVLDVH
ncbi:MAG: hypothetical protein ABSD73_07130 [Candidatus Bathyarchaeia archaeon]|jgi:hypothetical protein